MGQREERTGGPGCERGTSCWTVRVNATSLVMALPFFTPRDQATEEQYVRLEQLLRDLYLVLRALLGGGGPAYSAPPPSARPRPQQPQPPPPAVPQTVQRESNYFVLVLRWFTPVIILINVQMMNFR